jgi:hypothetical protein
VPATEDLLAAAPDEASLRLQVTDLLLSGLRDVRARRLAVGQSDVLQEIEAALEAYGSYFYPPEHG